MGDEAKLMDQKWTQTNPIKLWSNFTRSNNAQTKHQFQENERNLVSYNTYLIMLYYRLE